MNAIATLVTGATGRQGGSVARHLLNRGHRVRAMTRNPHSMAATELARLGAEIVEGDFFDTSSLERAMQGMDAVFAMSTPWEAGPEQEVEQGRNLIYAALAMGVSHFLLSSIAGADEKTGIPHFDSKFEIEESLRQSGLAYTILAPAFFMENVLNPMALTTVRAGTFALALPPETRLQQITVEDIGAFAKLVLERRDPFIGKRIDIAGDELTGPEEADILSDVTGQAISYVELPIEALREESEDSARMFDWFRRVGFHADVHGLRRMYPEVGWHRFADWVRTVDLSVFVPTEYTVPPPV